ncbi:hypothetical protein J7T55_007007 [Diaporthe amygdali]|uniref:uncharacterized protein n=1 Tax=Phomopsis amygdali TaxID=1214568 RepID=UPI0022FE094F|nr:uncharacterized protein J7T55_007007 [Diaporthe amygdali]KAJ0104081.1 hypothetical protein J7T55_007007 [Diaporthe amygdali]
MLVLLLTCICATRVTGHRYQHQRLWPPDNIEPCLIQCPVQHVQMTGNKSSGAEMSNWGAQPILDFMSNGQWQSQTATLPLLSATPSVDMAATSSITTLVTSVTVRTSPTRSQSMSCLGSASTVTMSSAEKIRACNIMCQVVIALSCVILFHKP